LLPRANLCVRGQYAAELAGELLVGDSRLGGDGDLVELPIHVEDALRCREVEAGECGAADGRDRPELHDPGDAQVLHRPTALDADGVADGESFFVGGRSVDDDFVAPRPSALDQLQRIELARSVCDREAQVGRPAVDDGLAVVADELGVASDAAFRGGDVWLRPNRLEE
jgi:hypothetical protein